MDQITVDVTDVPHAYLRIARPGTTGAASGMEQAVAGVEQHGPGGGGSHTAGLRQIAAVRTVDRGGRGQDFDGGVGGWAGAVIGDQNERQAYAGSYQGSYQGGPSYGSQAYSGPTYYSYPSTTVYTYREYYHRPHNYYECQPRGHWHR